LAALIFILTQERGGRSVPVERAKHRAVSLTGPGEEQLSSSSSWKASRSSALPWKKICGALCSCREAMQHFL